MTGSWSPSDFPKLDCSNHRVTSPCKNRYNCIAWAAGIETQWWWPEPGSFWPSGIPREVTLDAFLAAFSSLGYEERSEYSLEQGYEKIAFYAQPSGEILKPTHAAKQLPNGRWTSKLGPLEDIEHSELNDVSGPIYGKPIRFMRRPIG